MVALSDPVGPAGNFSFFYIALSRLMRFPKTASCHESAEKANNR
jgi:hypothetical protein